MDHEPETTKTSIYLSSITRSFFEIVLILLPALTWALVEISLEGETRDIRLLSAWPFASLSLFSAILKDGISAYHRENQDDKRTRDFVVTISICGLVLSTVLLTLSVVSAYINNHLFPEFHSFVLALCTFGVALFFVVKNILYQRTYFNLYK